MWVKPKRRRSQSNKKKEAAKKKAAEAKDKAPAVLADQDQEGLQDLTVLAKRAPWLQTTPHTRIQKAAPLSPEGELPIPPPPILPKPPVFKEPDKEKQGLTEEEQQLLKNLQGVRSFGLEMTDNMKEQLQTLELRQKETATIQVLNHGHLNRHKKLKEKVKAAAVKIQAMDAEWNAFVRDTSTKIQTHASLYQTCRGDLMVIYNQKVAELQQIQSEMKSASESLIAQPGEEVYIEELPDMTQQLEAMQSMLREAAPVETISDDEMDLPVDPSNQEVDEELVRDKPSNKPASNFRHSTSPSKVANQTLKAKNKWTMHVVQSI